MCVLKLVTLLDLKSRIVLVGYLARPVRDARSILTIPTYLPVTSSDMPYSSVVPRALNLSSMRRICFKTKPEIALEQIRWACETDLPGDLMVIDAGYGNASQLRAGITELGKLYVAGIQSQTLISKPSPRRGRAAKKRRRDASNAISVKELAVGLRAKAWHTIEWREGTNEGLSSRFARVRIHDGASHEPETSAE